MRNFLRRGRILSGVGIVILALTVLATSGCEIISDLLGVSDDKGNLALASLTVSDDVTAYALSPVFQAEVFNYTLTVSNAVVSINVAATAASPDAYVTINGSGPGTKSIALAVGANTVVIAVVQSASSTQRTYSLTINRLSGTTLSADANLASLSLGAVTITPSFVEVTLAYTASVPNATTSIAVSVTRSSSTAGVTIDGVSGLSRTVDLDVGTNAIPIVVTAENGTTKTYTVTVTRAGLYVTVLDLLAWGSGDDAEATEVARWVADFEAANPSVDVEYELYRDQAYWDRLDARRVADDPPDLVFVDYNHFYSWRTSDQAVDMTDYLDPTFFDFNAFDLRGPNDEIYYIPMSGRLYTSILYMNTSLSDSLDLGTTPPATYAELVAMVDEAQVAGKQVLSLGGRDSWMWQSCLLSTVLPRLSGDGLWITKAKPDVDTNSFTDQEFVDSLEFVNTMVTDGVIAPDVVYQGYQDSLDAFNAGNALFMLNGSWCLGAIDDAIADSVLVLPLPALPGEDPALAGTAAAIPYSGYGLTAAAVADPAVRDAAIAFLETIHSDAETENRLRYSSVTGVVRKNFPIPADLPSLQSRLLAFGDSPSVEVIDSHIDGGLLDTLNAGLINLPYGFATAQEIAAKMVGTWTAPSVRVFEDFQYVIARPWYAVTAKGGALTSDIVEDTAGEYSLHGTYALTEGQRANFALDYPPGWSWEDYSTLSVMIDNIDSGATGIDLFLNIGVWNETTGIYDWEPFSSPIQTLAGGEQVISFALNATDWAADGGNTASLPGLVPVMSCVFQLYGTDGVTGEFRIDDIELHQ